MAASAKTTDAILKKLDEIAADVKALRKQVGEIGSVAADTHTAVTTELAEMCATVLSDKITAIDKKPPATVAGTSGRATKGKSATHTIESLNAGAARNRSAYLASVVGHATAPPALAAGLDQIPPAAVTAIMRLVTPAMQGKFDEAGAPEVPPDGDAGQEVAFVKRCKTLGKIFYAEISDDGKKSLDTYWNAHKNQAKDLADKNSVAEQLTPDPGAGPSA